MRRVAGLSLLVLALLMLVGCATDEPVVVSREALGTVVTITAYGDDGQAVSAAVEDAYAAMAAVESQLDSHDPASALSRFNDAPYTQQVLPPDAVEVLGAIDALGVSAHFSPVLSAVTRQYDFEGGGTVPDEEDLYLALVAGNGFRRTATETAMFARVKDPDPRLEPGGALAPALDLGGASKGLALDRAREALRSSGAVTAALISSTSSTVTLGTKPDGSVWRVGVEDPRDTERVIAVFAFEGDGALSTSGDYQRYFEADGIRYHHILDPATGLPARGFRSVTVGGAGMSGLDADILSTALFVAGRDAVRRYAEDRGVALYAVDAGGRAHLVPAPERSGASVAEQATPLR
ncbi:MAG: FAD:protein FMN transferase [Coriobacteriia bacterium]|nr:FAD:protein FMN transferase [Coriobacteriia bacterium]